MRDYLQGVSVGLSLATLAFLVGTILINLFGDLGARVAADLDRAACMDAP